MAKVKRVAQNFGPANWLIGLGALSVFAGGLLSAALAHEPSRLAMWASAYLVLAAGAMQIIFGLLLRILAPEGIRHNLYMAVALYNIGGIGVIAGTATKTSLTGPTILVFGEVLLMLALVIIAYSVRSAQRSRYLVTLYVFLGVIFVSMLVGLFLATIIQLS